LGATRSAACDGSKDSFITSRRSSKNKRDYAIGRFTARQKRITAISHGLWLRVTLQFDAPRLRGRRGYAAIRHAKAAATNAPVWVTGLKSRQSAGRPRAAGLIVAKRTAGVSTDETVQPTKLTRSCCRASSALAG
jgi:hypothetical protein